MSAPSVSRGLWQGRTMLPWLIGLSAAGGSLAMADDKQARNYVNAPTARLESLVGPWLLTEDHFNAEGEVVAKVTGSEEITWVLADHAIRRIYTSGTKTAPYTAMGLLTWNDVRREYQGVWLDSVSTTGPRNVSGQWDEKTPGFVYILEALNPDGSTTRYRVVEQLVDENQRAATTYRLTGSAETKLIEVHYKRSRPCPGQLRMVPDEKIKGG